MASRDTADLNYILKDAYYKAIDQYKVKYPDDPQPFVTCTYRSPDEQNALYNSTPKVTNAKGGQSPHNFRPALAFDIGFVTLKKTLSWDSKLFKKFADIIVAIEPKVEWGGSWQGGFVDNPHFQLHSWKNYKQASA